MNNTDNFSILIVDDNPNNLFSLHALISKYLKQVSVIESTSGAEAIDIAVKTPIDLIILDVQMPEMDGFQTASMLKIRKKTTDIPIIFLTAAFKSDEFQQKGFAVGAVDYLLKPLEDNQLINKISTYIKLIEKERLLNIRLEKKVKERTAELAEAKQYADNILACMGEALIVLHPSGKIKSVNPETCRLLDYTEQELIGQSVSDLFEESSEEEASAFMGTWLEAIIRAGALKNIEARFISKHNKTIPILFSRSVIHDNENNITDIICISRDHTEFKEIEQKLQKIEKN
jgi:PAS domain S-box-containing protein